MKINLELEESDVQLVMQALGELPLKMAVRTFATIDVQYGQQKAAQAGQQGAQQVATS